MNLNRSTAEHTSYVDHDARSRMISFNATLPALRYMTDKLWIETGEWGKALKETKHDEEESRDTYFWTDDNAHALEAYIMPGVYEQNFRQADSILGFLFNVSSEGPILRRQALNRIEEVKNRDGTIDISNAIMSHQLNANMAIHQGIILHHNGPEPAAVIHQSWKVSFMVDNVPYLLDTTNATVTSYHLSSEQVMVKGVATVPEVAEATITYLVRDNNVVTRAEVSVVALGESPVSDVVVTLTKNLSSAATGRSYAKVCAQHADSAVICKSGRDSLPLAIDTASLEWFSVVEELGPRGFAYGFHTPVKTSMSDIRLSIDNNTITAIETVFKVPDSDNSSVVSDTFLSYGAHHMETLPYGELMKTIESRVQITDLSVTHDYGVALSSVASFAFFLRQKRYSLQARLMKVKGNLCFTWALKQLTHYMNTLEKVREEPSREMFFRGTAYALLGAIKLASVNRVLPIRKQLELYINRLTSRILERQHEDGIFLCFTGQNVSLDCHGAGVLALSWVLTSYENKRFVHAVKRDVVLESLTRAVTAMDYKAHQSVDDQDQLQLNMKMEILRDTDGSLWGYKPAILARGLNALEQYSRYSERLDYKVETTAGALRHAISGLLDSASRYPAPTKNNTGQLLLGPYREFLTSHRSNETNSETQPLCMLGYYPQYEEMYYSLLRK